MIDPMSVFVGRPIYGGTSALHDRGMLELVEDREIGTEYSHNGESSVSTARDYVVHYFLTRTRCQWLVWIDADIGFSRQDWRYLMEDQDNELAVCAEYLKKNQDLRRVEVANFGLGFSRVHRSVYERLDTMTRDDGAPLLLRYRAGVELDGERHMEEFVEYHPVGVTPDGSRRNEDHGFWLLVRLAGIPIRKETRTKLGHTGTYTWWYDHERLEAMRRRQHGGQ